MQLLETDRPTIVVRAANELSRRATLSVAGEVDISTSGELRRALEASLAAPCRELVIDLADVEFMDSSGLHALVEATQVFRTRGGLVCLVKPSQPVLRLLEITGLLRYFDLT